LGQAVYELADRITHEEAGDVIIDAKRFSIAHPELQRRLLNGALQWVASADYTPRHDALMEVAQAIDMRQTKTLHGCLITAGAADIRIGREFNAVWDATAQPSALWDGRWQLTGPAELGDEVRALGEEGLGQLPDWRAAGLPRRSLMASPSVWRADRLIAAPLASFNAAWSAKCATSYISSLLTH
jgi:tRNA(Ile)-lysidine synthase